MKEKAAFERDAGKATFIVIKANSRAFEDTGVAFFPMEQSKPRGKHWEGGKHWEVG